MMIRPIWTVALALNLCVGPWCVSAQGVDIEEPALDTDTGIVPATTDAQNLNQFSRGLSEQTLSAIERDHLRFLQRTILLLFQYSDTGSVTDADFEFATLRAEARARAAQVNQLLIHDLDANGSLSSDEVAEVLSILSIEERVRLTEQFGRLDSDSDGMVSLTEMLLLQDDAGQQSDVVAQNQAQIMEFDANSDGTVDAEEVIAVVHAAVRTIIQYSMEPAVPATVPRPSQQLSDEPCQLPVPAAGERVVFVSGYEGEAISTIAVAGQNGEATATTLEIEAGETPLYLFVTARDAMLWHVTGAVDRIAHLVIQPRRTEDGPGAAAIGVPAEIVEFVAPGSCISTFVTNAHLERDVLRQLELRLGRSFDDVITQYSLGIIPVPRSEQEPQFELQSYRDGIEFSSHGVDLEITPEGISRPGEPPANGSQRAVRQMMRHHPAGMVVVSADDVVAAEPVSNYDVLPGYAGLLQLLALEALEYRDHEFYIVDSFARLPAGLTRPSRYLLADNEINLPEIGTRGVTIYSRDGATCLAGQDCR